MPEFPTELKCQGPDKEKSQSHAVARRFGRKKGLAGVLLCRGAHSRTAIEHGEIQTGAICGNVQFHGMPVGIGFAGVLNEDKK